MKATFYSYTETLGFIELQVIDQSMGIVGGKLTPTDAYLKLQNIFRKSKGVFTPQLEELRLNIQLENGCYLYPVGAFSIWDIEEHPEEITVDAAGLHHNIIHDFFINAPSKPFLIEPWYPLPIDIKFAYEAELSKEIGKSKPNNRADDHILVETNQHAFANYGPSDDVLFYITGNATYSLAVVHLTWKGAKERYSNFPSTEFYVDFDEFRAKRMEPDSEDWE